MSKSLKRVRTALEATNEEFEILEMIGETRTAVDAARKAACDIDQIAKSIVFRGEESEQAVLFITAGGRHVDPGRARALAGEPLGRADASFVRVETGFAIGGVAPIAHKTPLRVFFDRRLLEFPMVFAAAGTPRHIFSINPGILVKNIDAQVSEFTS